MLARCVFVGTFCYGSAYFNSEQVVDIASLKNLDSSLHVMQNQNQILALVQHYGPIIYFHPYDMYMPLSVQWFFKNGANLYLVGSSKGKAIEYILLDATCNYVCLKLCSLETEEDSFRSRPQQEELQAITSTDELEKIEAPFLDSPGAEELAKSLQMKREDGKLRTLSSHVINFQGKNLRINIPLTTPSRRWKHPPEQN